MESVPYGGVPTFAYSGPDQVKSTRQTTKSPQVAHIMDMLTTMAIPVSDSATLNVPRWLRGGNGLAFFERAGLHATPENAAAGSWRIRTEEQRLRARPALVSAQRLAGPGVIRPAFVHLTSWARGSETLAGDTSALTAAISRGRRRAERSGAEIDVLNLCQLETLTASTGDLAEVVRQWFQVLRSAPLEGDPGRHPFGDASVHVILREQRLVGRVKLSSVLLRIQNDPVLSSGDTTHLQQALAEGRSIFDAAGGLMNGVILLDAYVAPLLGALSPAVWGIGCFRTFGVIIYAFGHPLTGTLGNAVELIQTLPHRGATVGYDVPELAPGAADTAINWWTNQLNEMFGILTNPGLYVDAFGNYQAIEQVQALATVEQLFRRVGAIQVAWRDANARLVLLFSVLDTLRTLTGRSLARHCSLTLAEKTLTALRSALPAAAAEVLLPAAVRAVEALRAVQQGFYLLKNDGSPETVTIRQEDGRTKALSPEQAAAAYIQLLRDANHGHGTNKPGKVEITNSLLGQHTGDMPHDLGLLGYLYLLDVLLNLDRLPRIISNRK